MILVDFTNIAIASIMVILKSKLEKPSAVTQYIPLFEDEPINTEVNNSVKEVDEQLVRHVIFNSLLSYRKKYPTHGSLVICCEGRGSWRKALYSFYKAHRAKGREDSPYDWNKIIQLLEQIISEIKENMPYKVIRSDGAESDDCIAVLAKNYKENTVIIANDKDFYQLQIHPNIIQYAPLRKKEVVIENPEMKLKEHIIYGDAGDGVPRIFDDDDTLLNPDKKQTTIYKKDLNVWLTKDFNEFCKDMEKVKRNQTLIDFSFIPKEIEEAIINEFENYTTNSHTKIYPYFIKARLSRLISEIRNF